MELTSSFGSLRSRFAQKAAADPEHIERIHAEIRQRQKADQEKAQLRREQHTSNMLLTHVLATRSEIAAFTDRLDKYDAATVEALMQNERKLDQTRQEIDRMLREAHVLPDGRRVFRTEDGQRVFDEHGQEVSREVIHPDEIGSRRPAWEAYWSRIEDRTRLTEEQQQLHAFQERADRARERIQEGNITRQELDDLAADLDRNMPSFVRETLDRRAGKAPAADQTGSTARPGDDIELGEPIRIASAPPAPSGMGR